MLSVDLSVASVAVYGPGVPSWPENTVALWLILGQSNAEGYAPWRQDPARLNAGAAVDALTAEERAAHDWVRFTVRGAGAAAGRFEKQGVATATTPRTSSKVWTGGGHGIPTGTESFGPEIGLIRHVLGGAAPSGWRDDASPRLYVFKQTMGGKSVDYFRWGGDGQALIADALREAGGETLTSLAASATVLVQGVIFVIGEKDSATEAPDGQGMAASLDVRFAEWVRQIRGALGVDAPVAFVEIHDAADADKQTANARLADLAAALPNAAVIARDPAWETIGDGVHYDAAAQDGIGQAAFGHLRAAYGRPGDGLVSGFKFTGLKPFFWTAPVFTDDNGSNMKVALTPSESGTVHAMVTDAGAPAPSADEIVAGDDKAAGYYGQFSRPVSQDVQANFFTGAGTFAANVDQDVWFVLASSAGARSRTVRLRRHGNVKFAPDLSLADTGVSAVALDGTETLVEDGGAVVVTGATAQFEGAVSFAGTLYWALYPGARDVIRPEDVASAAFLPAQAGSAGVGAGQTFQIGVADLAPGQDYTFIAAPRKDATGQFGPVQALTWTA